MSDLMRCAVVAGTSSVLSLGVMVPVYCAPHDLQYEPVGSQLEAAEQIAAREGRRVEDVMRDLDAQDVFGSQADRLQNELPQYFVDAEWLGSTGWIRVRPEGMQAAKALVGERFLISMDGPTREQRDALNHELTKAILRKKSGESFSFGIDPATLDLDFTLFEPKSVNDFQAAVTSAVAEVNANSSFQLGDVHIHVDGSK